MNLYMLQEFLGVLIVLAGLIGTIVIFAIAFVLFQEGRRRAVLLSEHRRHASKLSAKDQWLQRAHGRSALR